MGLIGCGAALVSDILASPWPFVAAMLVVGAFLAVTYYIDATRGDVGLTTEIAAVLTVLAGALAYWGFALLAVAMAVIMAVLLSIKVETHEFVQRLSREDIFAALKLAVISAIILPLLPNQNFGPQPFDIFNPFQIWLLVVFISGINFIGYVLVKLIGTDKGIGLTGLVGGLASSTAVTLSFTQRSKVEPLLSKAFALAITAAWTVMFVRVIVEVLAVNATLMRTLWLPLLAAMGVGLVYCLFLYLRKPSSDEEREVEFSNPFQLAPAIIFGLVFTLVLGISRASEVYLGDAGLYITSFFSGLATVDAITLSLAQLSRDPMLLEPSLASRAIVVAAVANTFAKGMIVIVAGSALLRRTILPGFILIMATALLLGLMI
jgi:uncharacterized membrane protein (DUF4010 family)